MKEDVLEVMEESDEPFLTVKEIADEVSVSKETVYNRLVELAEDNTINKKKVGSRAVIWWIPDRYQGRRMADASSSRSPSGVNQ